MKPFLLKMEVTTEDELAHLLRDAFLQMLSDDFCGGTDGRSILSKKASVTSRQHGPIPVFRI